MQEMNGNAYKLLGYLVWRSGKWYVRRRMPSARASAAAAGALLSGVAAAVVLGAKDRRLST